MRRLERNILLCWWLVAVGPMGCSGSLLAPRGGIVDPASLDAKNAIGYRTLTRQDFQATSPPPDASPYAKRIGALTCARVLTTPETSYRVREERRGDEATYSGEFQKLSFVALMDRSCSWWNPETSGLPESYVLQHEQIHFALVEIEARRLNARAPEIIRQFRVTGSSEQEVKESFDAKLDEVMQQAVNDILEVNTEFDEATSAKYAPTVQQEWYERVQSELASSGGH